MSAVQICRWRTFPTAAELQAAAAQTILQAASKAIAQRGRFDIVLAGGTTPHAIYEQLRGARSDWQHWHVWDGRGWSYSQPVPRPHLGLPATGSRHPRQTCPQAATRAYLSFRIAAFRGAS